MDVVIQSDPRPIPDDASPLSSEMDGLRETASNAISWLNPADIETITVLKDASATAIYGTKDVYKRQLLKRNDISAFCRKCRRYIRI